MVIQKKERKGKKKERGIRVVRCGYMNSGHCVHPLACVSVRYEMSTWRVLPCYRLLLALENMTAEDFSPSSKITGVSVGFRADASMLKDIRLNYKLNRISSEAMRKRNGTKAKSLNTKW